MNFSFVVVVVVVGVALVLTDVDTETSHIVQMLECVVRHGQLELGLNIVANLG